MAGTESAERTLSRLLLCSREHDSAAAMQGAVFCRAGYSVRLAADGEIQKKIENSDFNILVLNHSLSFDDRKQLARKAKLHKPGSGVLVLHHSGSLGNPYVDLAMDSRSGAKSMLRAVQRLEGMLHGRSHHPEELNGSYFVVADAGRNYTFVSDPVCDLLGYDRANLLDLRIDDVVAGATAVTQPLFQQFVIEGTQTGMINLRHRSGRLIPVQYWARVEPDHCMIARWEPLEGKPAPGKRLEHEAEANDRSRRPRGKRQAEA